MENEQWADVAGFLWKCEECWPSIMTMPANWELTQTTLFTNLGLIKARLLVVVNLVAPGAGQRDNLLRAKSLLCTAYECEHFKVGTLIRWIIIMRQSDKESERERRGVGDLPCHTACTCPSPSCDAPNGDGWLSAPGIAWFRHPDKLAYTLVESFHSQLECNSGVQSADTLSTSYVARSSANWQRKHNIIQTLISLLVRVY